MKASLGEHVGQAANLLGLLLALVTLFTGASDLRGESHPWLEVRRLPA